MLGWRLTAIGIGIRLLLTYWDVGMTKERQETAAS